MGVVIYRCPECTDPMEYYQQEVENGAESHQEEEDEVTAPDVEYLESEDVFPSLTPPPQTPPTSHPMTRRRKVWHINVNFNINVPCIAGYLVKHIHVYICCKCLLSILIWCFSTDTHSDKKWFDWL